MSVADLWTKYCSKVLRADLTNDTYTYMVGTPSGRENAAASGETESLSKFWDSCVFGGYVYPEDQPVVRDYVNVPFVSEFFRRHHGGELFETEFRYKLDGENYRLIRLLIIAAEDYRDDHQIVYVFLRETGRRLEEGYVLFDELLRGLSENYGAIYYVDFDRDFVRPYRMSAAIEEAFGEYFRSRPTYAAAMHAYINAVVSERDREEMLAVTKYEYMRQQLKDVRAYSHEYHLERGGREYSYRFKIANLDGVGELHRAVMGFANVTSEKSVGFSFSQQGKTVLVVEPNEEDRGRLCAILQPTYEVIAVPGGKEALEVLDKGYQDIMVVMTELEMPGMSGFDLIRHIKRVRHYSEIPVLVCSDNFFAEMEARSDVEFTCLQMGVSDFVLKPVSRHVVMNRIKQMIRLREATMILDKLEKDSLTGLYAKEFFYRRVSQHLRENPDESFVMWVTDIQGLKVINEKYGIEMGDEVLRVMAGNDVRFDGFILGGRIEGDKFAALIKEEVLPDVKRATALPDGGVNFPVPNVVIKHGFYHIRKHSTLEPQGMYDRALLALQKIKDSFGVYCAEYDDELRKTLLMRRQVADLAQAALDGRQFLVYYQPKYDIRRKETNGAEALVRWIHPELGFMNPGFFIPQFEKNGFIKQLDFYVWEEVCRTLREWRDRGMRMVPISVNVSRRNFETEDLAERMIAIVDRYGIDHSFFHVEVTESAYSDNPQAITETLRKLHESGFAVELDDFGSGYSSMSALSELSLDIMKLDMSLIRNDNPASDRSVLEFSVQLAKMMKLKTVAEGVETEEQAKRISSLGGDYIQGYFYSKPLPRAEFEQYLAKERA